MTEPYRITRHSASARVDLASSGVQLISFHGLITIDALLHFNREAAARAAAAPLAIVADFTASVLALYGRDLDWLAERSGPGCAPDPSRQAGRLGGGRLNRGAE